MPTSRVQPARAGQAPRPLSEPPRPPSRARESVLAHHPSLPRRVEIIDCTLRDGEQAPGVWFTTGEKIQLAQILDAAGIDVLDAGFPASCPEEIETLQALRDLGLRARIGATARAVRGDVLAADRARAEEVFLFLPTSDLRLLELGVTRGEAAERLRAEAEEVVARGMRLNVVAEDAYRSSTAWLIRLYESLHPVPIERLVICDTVGAAHPAGMERLVTDLIAAFGDDVVLATHCHNDFGMAGANSLAAVMAGARSVTCTVNGIGERAGNADLAEIVAALTHILGVEHPVTPQLLPPLCALVDRLSGMQASPLKAVTGFNVYSHESGVHVDGMLKDPRSYEHLPSSWTAREPRYVLGKSSGVALIHHLAASQGIALDPGQAREILHAMKARVIARSRAAHERIDREIRAFREQELTGIPHEEVIAEIVARASPVVTRRSGPSSVRSGRPPPSSNEDPVSHTREVGSPVPAPPRKRSAGQMP